FMPSNVGKYGVDTQGKGYPDPFETADALHSIANYLSRRGWTCRADHGQRYRAVWEYNHSHSYVATVLAVAERLRDRGKGSGKVVQVRKRERGASS
ncbi:MAG TPA: lytic murein transglycosylase, partial [Syntrophales bacterium]|nr:lytic murein transglycosylase [Syntrophales bacterium]HOM07898.1 lytic murein transglycosylase [Syntrophales bacterium]HOO00293.1 lytic murein transglycosylase [Syntrophales bacterium]HPC01792.1 lytic murein transglycosylase [Syntrophales bacterium]HPQ07389.1 lytic murein transglycosylase [Syntrophales bacterium]